ncbi:carboxypeptidase regulatory-like domain-containing protein [Planctomycetota bacterium]
MQKNWKALLYCFFLFIAIAQTAMAKNQPLVTTGQVVDDQSRPVEGAEIMVVPGRHKTVLSNSQGRFEINWNPRSWRSGDTVFYIIARQKATGLGLAMPIEQKFEDLRLVLKPGMSLSGQVVDTEGQAIRGVRLSIVLRASDWRATIDTKNQTDGNGDFTFDALPMENRYQFKAEADGYGQKGIYFDPDNTVNGRFDVGRIELPVANMSVSGRVVDIHGHPVPGLEVFCFGEGQPSCNTFSDEKGYFELRGVCAGLVRFMAEGRVLNKRVSRQVITEAGARDAKVIVKEGGNARSYYVRTKSHEDIINSGNPFIAGRVVDGNGTPVAEVPVNVRCVQKKDEQGRDTESYFNTVKFGDVTDQQGRFAIELEEDATYSLLFSPINHAAMIAYDILTDTRDLEVILPNGGTVTGQIVRFSRGKKVPVPDASVELKQMSRLSYSHIGYDRDRKTMTDSKGRFRFEHIRTLIRNVRQRSVFEPRTWELSYGETSQTVKFLPGETVKHLDLVIRPNLAKAASLTGKSLPDYTGINIDFSQDRFRDKRLLLCFFDYAQRPARHCILQLNDRLAQLQEQDIKVLAVQTSETAGNTLDQWIRKMNITILVDTVTGDIDETRYNWNVQSLPWLILTDREHVVTAEGFTLQELDDKLKTN